MRARVVPALEAGPPAIARTGNNMQSTELADVLVVWLRRLSSTETPPSSVVAFNVGLFQTEKGFTAYLAGAPRYDAEDADWVFNETFAPRERCVSLPVRRDQATSQRVQELASDAVRRFLCSPDGEQSFLADAQAVTVGFDDGDLVRVK
jgi:hypothetical protein